LPIDAALNAFIPEHRQQPAQRCFQCVEVHLKNQPVEGVSADLSDDRLVQLLDTCEMTTAGSVLPASLENGGPDRRPVARQPELIDQNPLSQRLRDVWVAEANACRSRYSGNIL
jgi:hypothetical protein